MPDQLPQIGAVFLSYASEDAEAAARICEGLRAAGIEVWFDRNELRGGDAWDSKIKKQIHDCALFVAVISAHTNARSEGYFRLEWKLATRRLLTIADDAAFLVPVVIDDTREGHARVPEEFTSVQWTRLPGGTTPPAFALRVRHMLGAPSSVSHTAQSAACVETAPGGRVTHDPKRTKSPVRTVGLALIVLSILGGGFFWYFQGASDSPATKPAAAVESPAVQAGPQEKAIAVLPFVNMSSDKEQEYFSDGLSEELLNLLSKVPELRVAARTSSFYFKGKDAKVSDIARELQVAHLLEGSVRKSGNQVRITAQLIRASDGYHQWSETYDRTLDDIFAVQQEIASAVVSQLKVTLLGAPSNLHKTTPEAYALFLQARQLDRQHAGRIEASIALYRRALAIDPNYAPAWLWLAEKYMMKAGFRPQPNDENVKVAREALKKALAIDPDYAAAHAGLGSMALHQDHDLAASALHLEHALMLDPQDPVALFVGNELNEALGRTDKSVELLEYLVSRDPMEPSFHVVLGLAYLAAGHLDAAMGSYRAALQLAPDLSLHANIAEVLLLKNQFAAALAEYRKVRSEPGRLSGLACAYHAMGQQQASNAALDELIENHADHAYLIAATFVYLGDVDRAFEWLYKTVTVGEELTYAPIDIWLKDLHGDPRWLPFLRKIGRAPEQLAAIKFEIKVPQH